MNGALHTQAEIMDDNRSDLEVAIIGAGFGGLGMGVSLLRAGIDDFLIFEKGDDVGGIWRDNTYPGCSCDVPSHLYSFSFQPYRDARMRFPGQQAILQYLREVADRQGLRPYLRLGTGIMAAAYNDRTQRWTLTTGAGETVTARAVVFAVGQLHRPHVPDIPGHGTFTGPAFHTARWDHAQNLAGRDVAVIGTGPSAAQLVPVAARTARRVRLFQRTPNWVLPKPPAEFGAIRRWAFARAPVLQSAYRAAVYYGADVALSPIISRGWSARPAEWAARLHLRWRIKDPHLRSALTPDYPIGCKRFIVDSAFYPALTRDNVDLITQPITRITPDGITTADGGHHDADIIVYATGFRATEFLVPIEVRGRDGISLHEQWAEGAEAYLGLALPGFPNMFIIHGPNSFVGHGSNIFIKECQIRYITSCLRLLRSRPAAAAIEVGPQAMAGYQQWLAATVSRTVWPAGCSSWYKTPAGRITNPWPASARRFDRLTRHDPARAFVPSTGRTGQGVCVVKGVSGPDR
jgi:cation diffusion facilitator CzcD-associated flavoprotein CzcO